MKILEIGVIYIISCIISIIIVLIAKSIVVGKMNIKESIEEIIEVKKLRIGTLILSVDILILILVFKELIVLIK